MEQWIREYIRASGAPDNTSLKTALTTTPPDQLLQLITTIRGSKLYTALLLAISRGHPEVAHLLLTPLRGIADELLFEKYEVGYTAMHCAVEKGDRKSVELMLHTVSSRRKYKLIAEQDWWCWTALTVAAERGYAEIIETLLIKLSVEQRVSLLKIQDINLYTAPHRAARCGNTTVLQSMLTSVLPHTVSTLLSMKNCVARTPLEETQRQASKGSVELLKSWKQPVLAAHAATYQKFAALHKADKLKSTALTNQEKELAESKQQIVALQETDNHKTAELTNQREDLAALKEADSQKAEELANQREELVESKQQIVALLEANNRMTADMAAMMGRLNRLDIHLRTPTDTDETGDQLHEPLG
ncbi:uncharacterized protein [Watersipora subatra]|uniref:uncharacterized protein n=1 Tax=Watersipora subatra TaxID=2589382 RepID=UPI00355AFA44